MAHRLIVVPTFKKSIKKSKFNKTNGMINCIIEEFI